MKKLWGWAAGVMLLLASCQGMKPTTPVEQLQPATVQPTATSIAKVETYNDILQQTAERKPQEPIKESKPIIEAQGKEIDATKDELDGLRTSIDGMVKEHNRQIAGWVKADEQWRESYNDLDGRWYVKWGKRIDTALNILKWAIGLGFVAMVVASAFKTFGGPVGVIATVIYNLLLNVFTVGFHAVGRFFRFIVEKKLKKT